MFEKLNIDVDPKSEWKTATPTSYTMSLPFYLLEWGHFIALKNYYTGRKNSNRFLLFHTLSGSGSLTYNNKTYLLSANTVAIIQCNASHHYETFSSEPWDFCWFHYNGTAAHIYYNLYNRNDLYIHQIAPDSREACLIQKITSSSSKYNLDRNLIISEWIISLMTSFILEKRKNALQDSPLITEKLNNAIDYMSEHLTEKITITDISNSVFLSQYHFLRTFKKQTGLTPYEYLINLRINKAKELLISTQDCLDDIAANSGFTDAKNLIYNFKRIVHLTPNEYRKDMSMKNKPV